MLSTFDGENDIDPHSKYPKRHRKTPVIETGPMNTLSVEEVAMWLLKLTRDSWAKGEEKVQQEVDETDRMKGKEKVQVQDDVSKSHSRTKFRCKICGRFFRSYQALGGHSGNHKKGYFSFECRICFKVFDSRQALGGHRKVHLSKEKVNANARDNLIDLNLPVPVDDVISTMSNAA